jgi:hypothetical protein
VDEVVVVEPTVVLVVLVVVLVVGGVAYAVADSAPTKPASASAPATTRHGARAFQLLHTRMGAT